MASKDSPPVALESSEIQQRLQAYEGLEAMKAALSRVGANEEALEALTEMGLSHIQLRKLISSLEQAAEIKARFEIFLVEERMALERAEELKKAVAVLRDFVRKTADQLPNAVRAHIALAPDVERYYLQALYEIERLIASREQIARETPGRIGATRKRHHPQAAENAAIGWLAISVMADYKVGYGKPPKETQFQPGASGNKKGRPKRSLDRVAEVAGEFMETIVKYADKGRTKTVSRREFRLR
jgi:hypothetical protein